MNEENNVPAESDTTSLRHLSNDRTGTRCGECGKGEYRETRLQDDWDGNLHCTECDHEVRRYRIEPGGCKLPKKPKEVRTRERRAKVRKLKQPTSRLLKLNVTKKFSDHLETLHQDVETINQAAPPELAKDIRENTRDFITWLIVVGAEAFLVAQAQRRASEKRILTPDEAVRVS
jgi:hypothetical protein